jgi:hypothetical protein
VKPKASSLKAGFWKFCKFREAMSATPKPSFMSTELMPLSVSAVSKGKSGVAWPKKLGGGVGDAEGAGLPEGYPLRL